MRSGSRPLEITVPIYGDDAVSCLTWSPDARHLVTGSLDGHVHRIDATDGSSADVAHHPGGVRAVAGAADGTVASAGHDRLLRLRRGGGEAAVVDLGHWAHALAWAGDQVAVAAGPDVAVHRPDGSLVRRWPLQPGAVHTVTWWEPRGLVVAGGVGGLRTFDPGSAGLDPVWRAPSAGAVLAAALDPRGARVAVADLAGEVRVVPLGGDDEAVLSGYPERVRTIAWCDGGRGLAAEAGDEVTVWGVGDDGELSARPRHLLRHAGDVTATAAAPRSAVLAVGDTSGEVRLWDVEVGSTIAAVHAPGEVTTLAWSPVGLTLAVGTGDGATVLVRLI